MPQAIQADHFIKRSQDHLLLAAATIKITAGIARAHVPQGSFAVHVLNALFNTISAMIVTMIAQSLPNLHIDATQAVNHIHKRPQVDQNIMVRMNTEVVFHGQRQGFETAMREGGVDPLHRPARNIDVQIPRERCQMGCPFGRVKRKQNNGVGAESAIIGALLRAKQQNIHLTFRVGQNASRRRHLDIRPNGRPRIIGPGAAFGRSHLGGLRCGKLGGMGWGNQ